MHYPFGKIHRRHSGGITTDEKFTGKELDNDNDERIYYFGARYYDSNLGRWMGPDPLASKYPGWSPYNYVMGNPLSRIDPNGMDTTSVKAVAMYDTETNTEAVVETVIEELGNQNNPANGNTTLTSTNVAIILDDGTVLVTSTLVLSNPLMKDAITTSTVGGANLLTKPIRKYVAKSAKLMSATGMGSVRTFAQEYNSIMPSHKRKENRFNIAVTLAFTLVGGPALTQTASFLTGAGYAQTAASVYENLQFTPININSNIIQRIK